MDTEVDFPVALGDGRRGCRFTQQVERTDGTSSTVAGVLAVDTPTTAVGLTATAVVDLVTFWSRSPAANVRLFSEHDKALGEMTSKPAGHEDGSVAVGVLLERRGGHLYGQVPVMDAVGQLLLSAEPDVQSVWLHLSPVQ